MTEYDAVVYDLDGTLVSLPVDWEAVAVDVREVYETAGTAVPEGDLWALLEAAPEAGLAAEVEATIAAHERDGARTARKLPRAEEATRREVPVGVCSLNCEAACRLALERHDLDARVEVVVGRDSVASRKPDPGPLLEAVRGLSAAPDRTLFVGDSRRDELTARRAGTAFARADRPLGE